MLTPYISKKWKVAVIVFSSKFASKDSKTPKSVALLSSWSLQLEPLSPGMLLAQGFSSLLEGRKYSIIVHRGYILELQLSRCLLQQCRISFGAHFSGDDLICKASDFSQVSQIWSFSTAGRFPLSCFWLCSVTIWWCLWFWEQGKCCCSTGEKRAIILWFCSEHY